ncbi:TPA: Lrp/AsnC family transcriptional regulator [Candidatus Micrarchaeota archaeon]|nr:Lrp/AsnC family transcriptional regulator [Candidatus Micrarchaeota archaeon]
MVEYKLDEKDFAILDALEKNAKQSVFQLAKKTGIPPTTIHNRIRKLKKDGVIEGYSIRLNHEKTGMNVCALVFVFLDNNKLEPSSKKGGLARQFAKYPNVDEVFETTGSMDIIVKVYGSNIRDITDFVLNKVREVSGVVKTETVITLSEIRK